MPTNIDFASNHVLLTRPEQQRVPDAAAIAGIQREGEVLRLDVAGVADRLESHTSRAQELVAAEVSRAIDAFLADDPTARKHRERCDQGRHPEANLLEPQVKLGTQAAAAARLRELQATEEAALRRELRQLGQDMLPRLMAICGRKALVDALTRGKP